MIAKRSECATAHPDILGHRRRLRVDMLASRRESFNLLGARTVAGIGGVRGVRIM